MRPQLSRTDERTDRTERSEKRRVTMLIRSGSRHGAELETRRRGRRSGGEKEREERQERRKKTRDKAQINQMMERKCFPVGCPCSLPPNAGRAGGDHQATRRAPGWAAPYWLVVVVSSGIAMIPCCALGTVRQEHKRKKDAGPYVHTQKSLAAAVAPRDPSTLDDVLLAAAARTSAVVRPSLSQGLKDPRAQGFRF